MYGGVYTCSLPNAYEKPEYGSKIYYTSIFGEPIMIEEYVWDASVVSNTYDPVSGGCIEFDDIITVIPSNAFRNNFELFSITLPDGIETIGNSAFDYCDNLGSITIPVSINSIAFFAIRDCYNLSDITYNGTMSQWSEVSLEPDWATNIRTDVVHCTDGDVSI